jgi:isocitrate/isopropylmalate dehydrogenase
MSMLLDFLGETEAAARIIKAVDSVPADRSSSPTSTTSVGDAIAERV